MSGFICSRPGMQMEKDKTKVKKLSDGTWEATRPIGSLFGSEVEGKCRGVGKSREKALEALKQDESKLYDSLWE